MQNVSRSYLSLGEVADLLSAQSWRIARLFELGVLPEPERVAGRRMIPREMVPEVAEALRNRGWLTKQFCPQIQSDGHTISAAVSEQGANRTASPALE